VTPTSGEAAGGSGGTPPEPGRPARLLLVIALVVFGVWQWGGEDAGDESRGGEAVGQSPDGQPAGDGSLAAADKDGPSLEPSPNEASSAAESLAVGEREPLAQPVDTTPGHVVVTLATDGGLDPGSARLVIRPWPDGIGSRLRHNGLRARSNPLPPGPYGVELSGSGLARQAHRVDVPAGGEAALALTLTQGHPYTVYLAHDEDGFDSQHAHVVLTDAAGGVVFDAHLLKTLLAVQPLTDLPFSLAEGTYSLRVDTPPHGSQSAEITVVAGAPGELRLTIP
jgi:hypothetical protein